MVDRASREVDLSDGRNIEIITLTGEESLYYPFVYRTPETKDLDNIFSLNGERVERESSVYSNLSLSTGASSLGDRRVEEVMFYFSSLAKYFGQFVGVSEELLRDNIRDRRVALIPEESKLDHALEYRDHANSSKKYLGRLDVEDVGIIYPQNLKFLFM